MNKLYLYGVPVFFILLTVNAVFGQSVDNTATLNTSPQNTQVNNTHNQNTRNNENNENNKETQKAEDWDLTPEEWEKYQTYMQGKDGHWYPQLTPPEILGLHAQTPEEQKHFAEIVAKEEHDKLARELAFNNAVHQAMLRLYANEPVIKPFDISPYNPIAFKNKKSHGE